MECSSVYRSNSNRCNTSKDIHSTSITGKDTFIRSRLPALV
jgi:hypothetical protein